MIPGDRQNHGQDCQPARISRSQLYGILSEQKPVSPAIAVKLGKLFGDGAGIWLRMQAAYDQRTPSVRLTIPTLTMV
jgi:plasmid maintenance system antidote protein VapI